MASERIGGKVRAQEEGVLLNCQSDFFTGVTNLALFPACISEASFFISPFPPLSFPR